MKRSILTFLGVLFLIGINIHKINSGYEYDAMAIFVQSSMIIYLTVVAIEAWINEKKDKKS
tara:strand:+ start:188 stop:370 length:183 start_codon:yes stop_codon:yes gene_type:complete